MLWFKAEGGFWGEKNDLWGKKLIAGHGRMFCNKFYNFAGVPGELQQAITVRSGTRRNSRHDIGKSKFFHISYF
jgi:hypothetical protein